VTPATGSVPAELPRARITPGWVWIAALALAYVVLGRLGLTLAYYQQNATLIWAPSGLAVAAVWLGGPRMAIGVWIGALTVNLAISTPPALAATIACGNTAEALVAAALASRFRIDPRLRSIRDVLLLVALLVGASTVIAATVGALALYLLADLSTASVLPTWLIWWLGDAGGVLVMTPLVLAFCREDVPARAVPRGIAETLLLAFVIVLSVLLASGGDISATWLGPPIALLPYPALTWAAIRFGMRGAAVTVFLVIVGAVIGQAIGTGPFRTGNLHLDTGMLWVFMATLGTSALVLAASLEERTRAENERHAMALRLERSEHLTSLGMLAGGIAHDFNNLLTVIAANTERTEGDAGDAVRTATRRAAELTNQLLAYAGQRPMERADVDLAGMAGETVRMLATSVPRTVSLRDEHEDDVPWVVGDPAQLRQVVLNLIVNAVDALDERPGFVRVRTFAPSPSEPRPDDVLGDRWVVLAVEDNGRGMDEETRRRVFEPFFTTKATGRGLGMAAVQGIVRSHGGRVAVRSSLGHGTEFQVWLPPSPRRAAHATANEPPRSEPVSIPAAAPPPAASPVRRDGRRVALVIDDEPAIRHITRAVLEEAGWRVLVASGGDEGLAMIEVERPDVVLLDLTMPKRSGADVLAAIRERHTGLPVVLMSGYSTDLLDGRGLEGADFLQKPFTIEQLFARLNAATA